MRDATKRPGKGTTTSRVTAGRQQGDSRGTAGDSRETAGEQKGAAGERSRKEHKGSTHKALPLHKKSEATMPVHELRRDKVVIKMTAEAAREAGRHVARHPKES